MCGIVGLLGANFGKDEIRARLRSANDQMLHRGPDDEGYHVEDRIGIAMRRLSIIDLSGGHQPLVSADGQKILVCNGEIYNYVELRRELEAEGAVFKTHSDCETILHLYEKMGVELFPRLRGMFAFALLDRAQNKLILGRDRFGERPLYFAAKDGAVAFASEMKVLAKVFPESGSEIDPESVFQFLTFQYVHEPRTMFKGVTKLPAAHFAQVDLGDLSVRIRRYWSYLEAPRTRGNPVELVRQKLDDAVKVMLRADVPVGLSLSGGIDSSLIAALIRKNSSAPVKAFSVGYPGRPENDERRMAEDLARKLDIDFHDVELSESEFVENFPKLIWDMDDPVGDIAAFGYWAVNRLAHEHGIKVLMSGLGADELFWGYAWVRRACRDSRFKALLKKAGIGSVIFRDPGAPIFFERLEWVPASAAMVAGKMPRETLQSVGLGADSWRSCEASPEWSMIVPWLLNLHNETWLTSNCLALSDHLGMAHSVETRIPFLDHELVDAVTGLRRAGLRDECRGHKSLLKRACGDLLPAEILNRPKRGFTPPVAAWMGAVRETYGDYVKGGLLEASGMLIPGAADDIQGPDATGLKFRMVLLEAWCRLYSEKSEPKTLSRRMAMGDGRMEVRH